ncbi:MAG TPA: peptide-methionine (S)-S-oxide reductase MsrA [Anaeromyxobacter sp.]|nr:peptide-methionine (S)-S-oxide reductase MsrA [Anaeromyxobacter sp.]
MKGIWWFVIVGVVIVAGGAILAQLPVRAPADGPQPPIGNPALGTRPGNVGDGTPLAASGGRALAIFAQGCFWGVEERFRRVPGVVATAVGYTGGRTSRPTYERVSAGDTGHAEAVLLEFDPRAVSYERLLEVFWETHDPTSGDRQGPDRGPQYRSAIFTLDAAQEGAAKASRDALQERLADPITTEIAAAGPFWIAEDRHQQWDEKHGARSCPLPERPRRR